MSNWWGDDPGTPDQPTVGQHPAPQPPSTPQHPAPPRGGWPHQPTVGPPAAAALPAPPSSGWPDQPTIPSLMLPPQIEEIDPARRSRAELLMVVGIGFLVVFAFIVLLAPLVTYRLNLLDTGQTARLGGIRDQFSQNGLIQAVIGAVISAILGFASVRKRWLTPVLLLVGLGTLGTVAGALADSSEWGRKWDGDSITAALPIALVALTLGVIMLLGAVLYLKPRSGMGVAAGLGMAAALVGGGWMSVAGRTHSTVQGFVDEVESAVIESCDGSLPIDLATNVGRLVIMAPSELDTRSTRADGIFSQRAVYRDEFAALASVWREIASQGITIDGRPAGLVWAGHACPEQGSAAEEFLTGATVALEELPASTSWRHSLGAGSVLIIEDGRLVMHSRLTHDVFAEPYSSASVFYEQFDRALRDAGYSS